MWSSVTRPVVHTNVDISERPSAALQLYMVTVVPKSVGLLTQDNLTGSRIAWELSVWVCRGAGGRGTDRTGQGVI